MRKKITDAIILAAGRGVRLKPLTNHTPKGMLKVKQKSIISSGIKRVKKYIKNIHVTIGYKGPLLAKHVIEKKVSSIINTEGKGNAWWIFNSNFRFYNRPIFVLTCDNLTNINFSKVEEDYYKKREPLCMLIAVKPIKGLNGDYIFSRNNIVKKLSRQIKANVYCSGIQILNPGQIYRKINKTQDFNHLWKKLIKKKQLMVSDVMPKKWFTIDTINNLNTARKNKI